MSPDADRSFTVTVGVGIDLCIRITNIRRDHADPDKRQTRGVSLNHNEALVVRTGVKARGVSLNHNEALAR